MAIVAYIYPSAVVQRKRWLPTVLDSLVDEFSVFLLLLFGIAHLARQCWFRLRMILTNRHVQRHVEQMQSGFAAFNGKDYNTAIEEFEALLRCRKCGENELGRTMQGLCLQMQCKYREAMDSFQHAQSLAPDSERPLKHLAYLLACAPSEELRDGQRALELATRAYQTWGASDALAILAAAQAELGEFESAIRNYEHFLELIPDDQRQIRYSSLELLRSRQPFRCNPDFDRSRIVWL